MSALTSANDLFDIAIALVFQFHQDVAGISFCHRGQPKLQSRSPRSAFHLRNLAQHRFDVTDDAIGLCQGTAGRHDVVEDESAFVHFRQQVWIREGETEKRNYDQPDAEGFEQDGALQSAPQPSFVKINNA